MATITPPPSGSDSSDLTEIVGGFIGGFFSVLFGAVGLMLALKAAHELWSDVPPAGYLQCVCLLAGVGGVSLIVKGWK